MWAGQHGVGAGATYEAASGGLLIGSKTLELLVKDQDTAASTATLAGKGIRPVAKSLHLDVGALLAASAPAQARFFSHDKLEGVAVVDGGTKLVISNDSDFGIDGVTNTAAPFQLQAKADPATGKQDEGEFLVIDLTRLPAAGSTATVTITTADKSFTETTITGGPSSPTTSTSADFAFSGTDSGIGLARFECALDDGAFATCTSPKAFGGLSLGSHRYRVRAIDAAPNPNVDPTPATSTWEVHAATALVYSGAQG